MFALANLAYSITKGGSVSIAANKKFSTANKSRINMSEEMPRTQLPEFLEARITTEDEEGKLSGSEVERLGGPAKSHISQLMSGSKDPWGMSAKTICKLATGLGEDPILVFRAVIGKLEKGITNEAEQRTFDRYKTLTPEEQSLLEFQWKNLRHNIDEIIRKRKD